MPLPAKVQEEIIPVVCLYCIIEALLVRVLNSLWQLPFWALVSFGAYLLFKLGYGVLTFNDVPEAHNELMKEIEQARKELKAKGVSVD